MLTDFKSYKEQYGGRYEVNGAGDLVSKLKLNLSLPKDAIRFHKKSNHGNYNIYNINILKKHYKIALVSSPRAAGGGYMGDFCNEESQEVLIGDKDSSDDEINFAPRDGRRSSSLLSMRSLTSPLQDIENELENVMVTNDNVTTEVVYQNPLQHLNEDDDENDDDEIATDFFLLRDLLSLEDQIELFEYIEKNDKSPGSDGKPPVLNPAPKTLLLGDDGCPTKNYEFADTSVVNRFVKKASERLKSQDQNIMHGFDLCQFKSLSMATIQYKAPHGRFPPHVDHCNESFVFLISIGCTANFMVKGPLAVVPKRFKLFSGDMLVFNSSTEAAILHAVESIDETGSAVGISLASKFPVLCDHRYGVQIRMHF